MSSNWRKSFFKSRNFPPSSSSHRERHSWLPGRQSHDFYLPNPMIVGIPKEIKTNEDRVSLVPVGAETLKSLGHSVLIETKAGIGSGFDDESYKKAGADIVGSPKEVYAKAEMIMKVKEPLPPEYPLIRKDQIIFTYFHFASSRELTDAMIKSRCIAIAYET